MHIAVRLDRSIEDALSVQISVGYKFGLRDAPIARISPYEYQSLLRNGCLIAEPNGDNEIDYSTFWPSEFDEELLQEFAVALDTAIATLLDASLMVQAYDYLMGTVDAPPSELGPAPEWLRRQESVDYLVAKMAYLVVGLDYDGAVKLFESRSELAGSVYGLRLEERARRGARSTGQTADLTSISGLVSAANIETVSLHRKKVENLRRTFADRDDVVPIFLGSQKEAEETLVRLATSSRPIQSVLEAGLSIDVSEWVSKRFEEDPEYYDVECETAVVAEWPPLLSGGVDEAMQDTSGLIGLIPARDPTSAIAYLQPGGWNDCPEPEIHVAISNHWAQKYQAELVTVTPDTIEFIVGRPPASVSDATVLAREQFAYCGDIVRQGVGSLSSLANSLVGTTHWYFWWD
ncbi:MAG: DUF4253 domain-containing protein [Pseudomonadota bacterium]